jgi:hypothetical protein
MFDSFLRFVMTIQALIVDRGRDIKTVELQLPKTYSNRSAFRYARKVFPDALMFTLVDG